MFKLEEINRLLRQVLHGYFLVWER